VVEARVEDAGPLPEYEMAPSIRKAQV
jgi:hypothetical protein